MMIPGLASPLTVMTPRTQQLYAVGETSTRELEKVSDVFKLGGRANTGPASIQGAQAIKTQLISNLSQPTV